MSINVQRDARKKWARPTLQRLDAGSAENQTTGVRTDSNPGGKKLS